MSTTTLTAFIGVTGLTDVGYRFINEDGVFTGLRLTGGVYELPGGRGVYGVKNPAIPAAATKVYWDSTATFAAYAYEQLDLCLTRLLVDRDSLHNGLTTYNGNVSYGDGFLIGPPSTVGRPGWSVYGNNSQAVFCQSNGDFEGVFFGGQGSKPGLLSVGGATGHGIKALGGNGGAGFLSQGGATGAGFQAYGGAAGGAAIQLFAQNGSGLDVSAANGIALVLSGLQAMYVSGPVAFTDDVLLQAGLSIEGALTATHAANDFRLGTTERANIANAVDVKLTAEHDDGSWAGGGSTGGTGAHLVTLTVTDNATPTHHPVQGVGVSVYHLPDGLLVGSGTTDAAGHLVIAVDAGSFRVALVHPLYYYAPEDRTVTFAGTPPVLGGTLLNPLVMALVTVPAGPPGTVLLSGTIRDEQTVPVVGCIITVELVPGTDVRPITAQGNVISFRRAEIVTNGSGFAGISLIPTNAFDQPVTYKITSDGGELDSVGVTITGPMDFEDLSP